MLYFRGCTARQKETGIADATEKLLKLADVDYHVLVMKNVVVQSCLEQVLKRKLKNK